jgi:DNA polymerase III alpha subunit
VTLVGYPITLKRVFTSAREVMAFFSFEDETALFETVLFPEIYRRYERLLGSSRPLVIQGVVESDEGALTVEVDRLSSL